MKMKLLFCAALLGVAISVSAQTNVFPASGNVGIGTLNPNCWFVNNGLLEVSANRPVLKLTSNDLSTILFTNSGVDQSNHYGEFHLNYQFNSSNNQLSLLRFAAYPGGDIFTLQANGNVGIGTTSPSGRIHSNVIGVFDVTPLIRLGNDDNTGRWDVVNAGNPTVRRVLQAFYQTTKTIQFDPAGDTWFNTGGNIGIGTTSPQNKLDVNGTIHAKEVKVDLTGWSDFVFAPSYKLKPLTEIEQYIKTHNHLPEIPSAKEVEQNGVSLGDMQAKLLQKVEELTLYSIEQEEKLEEQDKAKVEQEKKNTELEQKLTQQAKEIEELKQLINQKLK